MSGRSLRRLSAFALIAALTLVLPVPVLAGELRSEPLGRPAVSLLDAALSLLDSLWAGFTSVAGNNGAGIDPNGGEGLVGDNGAGIDPNGGEGLTAGDNGAGIDPNG